MLLLSVNILLASCKVGSLLCALGLTRSFYVILLRICGYLFKLLLFFPRTMVNKQYSVSGGGGNNGRGNDLSSSITKKLFSIKRNITKRNSASLGNISIISLHPEPDPLFVNSVSGSYYQKYSVDGGVGCYGDTDSGSGSSIYSGGVTIGTKKKSEYMFAEEKLDNCDVVSPRFSACAIANPVRNVKELTINDIGRFQYILEMDNELVCKVEILLKIFTADTYSTYLLCLVVAYCRKRNSLLRLLFYFTVVE